MTIARQLDELKAAGLVEIVRHGKGTRTVNTYRLTGHYTDWESSSPQATTEEGLSSSPQATSVVAPRLQGLSPPGYLTSSPQATGNPPFNPGLTPPPPPPPPPPTLVGWGFLTLDSTNQPPPA